MFQSIIRIINGCRGYVFGIKRLVPVVALVSSLLLLFPQHGYAKYRDPYQRTTLNGNVNFIFSKGKYSDKRINDERYENYKGFSQIYSLSMRGKFLARRLAVYDVSVRHTVNNVNGTTYSTATKLSNTSKDKNKRTIYSFKTSILPKSAIPLTLSAERSYDANAGVSQTKTSTRSYGLDWSILLKTLPEVHTSYANSTTTDVNGDRTMQNYKLRVLKDYGITKNLFSATRVNTSTYEDKASNTNLIYTNRTQFSRRTELNANAAKIKTTSSKSGGVDGTSADMYLNSAPGADFNQRHAYSYRLTKAADTSENTLYSGALRYAISERLSTHLSLDYRSYMTQDATQTLKKKSLDTSDSLRYRLTRRLTWRIDADYAEERTNAPYAQKNGLNWTRYKLTTGLDYKRTFKSFKLGLTSKIGYVGEEAGATGAAVAKQRGVTYGAGISLSRVKLGKYATMNASYNYTQSKDSLRNSFTDTRLYSSSISNVVGAKYVNAGANYSNRKQTSWYTALNEGKESYGGSIGSNIKTFKKTKAKLIVKRIKSYSFANGNTRSNQINAVVNVKQYRTPLGETLGDIDLSRNSMTNSETSSITNSSLYSLRITHQLLFLNKTKLEFETKRFKNATNNVVAQANNDMTAGINHTRALIGGTFTAQYSYRVTKRQYQTNYEAYKTSLLSTKIKKVMFGGEFSGLYSFNKTTGSYLGTPEKYSIHTGEAQLTKPISAILSVQLVGLLSRVKGTFAYSEKPSVSEIRGSIRYALRSWMISAEYSNKISKYIAETVRDNRVMLSVSRGFARQW